MKAFIENNMIAPLLLVSFLFFMPISPSMKSILMIGAILSLLVTPHYNQHIGRALNSQWGKAALLFFIFVILACCWSPAPWAQRLAVVEKYSKLVYLPILSVGFIRAQTRQWCIHAFLAAMTVTCLLCILKALTIIPGYDPGEFFYNHIVTGFMVALACYIAALYACKTQGWQRIAYLTLVLLTSYHLFFINTGRTAYVIYSVLLIVFCMQKLSFRNTLLAFVSFAVFFVLCYCMSSRMQVGINGVIENIHQIQQHSYNHSWVFACNFINMLNAYLRHIQS